MKVTILLILLYGCASHRPKTIHHPEILDLKASGTSEYIRDVIMAEVPAYQKCFEDEYQKTATKHVARVMLRFTIDKDGSVKKSKTESDQIPATIHKCLEEVSSRLKFAPVKNNETVDVSQPLNFN